VWLLRLAPHLSGLELGVKHRLPWPECEIAAYAGMRRRLLAVHDGRPRRYGYQESDPFGTDVQAAGAECAVARYANLYWSPWVRWPARRSPDVGLDVQVRRRSVVGWDLIVHEDDPDDHRIVLVYGELPDFELVGWVWGHEAKQGRQETDPYGTGRPAYWIPPPELRPMETW
jgi:hypothetical protein